MRVNDKTASRRCKSMCRIILVIGFATLLSVQSLMAETAPAKVTYYYTDPHGTVLATADEAGNVTATSDYRPYGVQALGTPEAAPGYTGHVNDPDSGLVYMQARYYDPGRGGFLSVDPVEPVPGNLFNFSRYSYAQNNPVVNLDPTGKAACPGKDASVCIQADVADPSRLSGRNVVATQPVANAMVDGRNLVAVRRTDAREEKIGFVVPNADGTSRVIKATQASTTAEATRDTATAIPPADVQAVIHGHIDGKSDGVVSDTRGIGDFAAVAGGLPNGVVSNGRVGVNELVNGIPQLRMLKGTMTSHEIQASQVNLNRVLGVFENPVDGGAQ